MTYAQRPMGDYKTYGYAGDPGWLTGLFKVAKKLIFRKAAKEIARPLAKLAGTGIVAGATTAALMPGVPTPPPGTIGGAVTMPGGVRFSAAYVPHAAAIGEHAPSGYHLDKATRSRWVRNRRMNVANPRALRKAMRRVQGFEKLAKRTIQFTRRVRIKK